MIAEILELLGLSFPGMRASIRPGARHTIFDDDKDHHQYDQIAWFSDPTQPGAPSLLDGLTHTGHGGNFDFIPHALRDPPE